LIGRSYSAALERGRKLTNDGKDFYAFTVGPKIYRKKIDSWFASIPPDAAPGCQESIVVHKKLQDLFRTMIDRNQRSLASKYLHFHFPGTFFLYDSRAARSITWIVPSGERCGKVNSRSDRTYSNFVQGCLWIRGKIHEQFTAWLTPRELDRLLLDITNYKPKPISLKPKFDRRRSKFVGKSSDLIVTRQGIAGLSRKEVS
jgi:hypothetical protein